MRIALPLIAVLGCGGKGASTARPPARTPYLMLFERGRAFSWAAVQEADLQQQPKLAKATCRVTEVKPVGDSTVAHVTCDAPFGALLIAGTWVATPAGLYHPDIPVDDPDELTLLGDDELLIAAIPAEREHTHVVDQAREAIEAFADRGSWCVRHTTTAGDDRRRYAICFDGVTVTGAVDFVQTGVHWERVDLGQAPVDDDES